MTDRIRQSLGAICLAVLLLGAAWFVRDTDSLAAILVLAAVLFGGVGLANIALDLLSSRNDG